MKKERNPEPARWFIFRKGKLLTVEDNGRCLVPILRDPAELGFHPHVVKLLGEANDVKCFAAELGESYDAPVGMAFRGLRSLFGILDEQLFGMAMRALGIINWERISQFCSQCGAKIESKADILAKACDRCGFISFPRISPAVIVLVEKGNEMLLARASRFAENLYSVIAGFVEPGETLEEVVRREVKEETGIDVKEIQYFGSQPWPFPDSLMIGFTAKYAGGEIKVDGDEVVDAGWFHTGNLPDIPGKISISRSLIDWFIEKHTQGKGAA